MRENPKALLDRLVEAAKTMARNEHDSEIMALREIAEREGYRRCDVGACNCGGYHFIGRLQPLPTPEEPTEQTDE